MQYTIKKIYSMEYAHRVHNQLKNEFNQECLCRHVHGHSGKVMIEIKGTKLDEVSMIVDFTNLKSVKKYLKQFDHALIISRRDPDMMNRFPQESPYVATDDNDNEMIISNKDRLITVPGVATSEEIATHMFKDIGRIIEETRLALCKGSSHLYDFYLSALEFSETSNNTVRIES